MPARSRISDDDFVAAVSGKSVPGSSLREIGALFPVPLHPESVRRRISKLVRSGKLSVLKGAYVKGSFDPEFFGRLSCEKKDLERLVRKYEKALDKIRGALN